MRTACWRTHSRKLLTACVGGFLLLMTLAAHGDQGSQPAGSGQNLGNHQNLVPIDDDALSTITGEGIALALHDFRFMMKPTSYFEQVGSVPAALPGFKRGDLRWYGINLSGAAPGGIDWNDTAGAFGTTCDASMTTAGMGCPRGGPIAFFSPFDNPYLLRAFDPIGISYAGTTLNAVSGAAGNKIIYEFLAPTAQSNYTLSWWGETEVDRTGGNSDLTTGTGSANYGRLKSQVIVRGNAAGSVFRLFQYANTADPTFAIFYHSYLRGNFRVSVAQRLGATNDTIGQPPRFDPDEGMFFMNVNAFFPFGQLYYQALTVEAVGTAGNFALNMARPPSATAAVYDSLYALRTDAVEPAAASPNYRGYETARRAMMALNYAGPTTSCTGTACFSGNNAGLTDYTRTHGYSTWGDWYPLCQNPTGNIATGCLTGYGRGVTSGLTLNSTFLPPGTRNTYYDTTDGIFFKKCTTGSCANFDAYAYRLTRIDVDTDTGTAGNQTTFAYDYYGNASSLNGTTGVTNPNTVNARIIVGDGGAAEPGVNIGDGRIAGILISYFRLESCLGLTTC